MAENDVNVCVSSSFSKGNLFPLTRNDLITLLFFYDAAYVFYWSFVESSHRSSFTLSILVTLIAMFIIVLAHMFSELDEIKLSKEEKLLRNKIKDEYSKVYTLKRKKELLEKTGYIEQGDVSNIVSEVDDPVIIEDSHNQIKKVHFNYLKRFSTTRLNKENLESDPQG